MLACFVFKCLVINQIYIKLLEFSYNCITFYCSNKFCFIISQYICDITSHFQTQSNISGQGQKQSILRVESPNSTPRLVLKCQTRMEVANNKKCISLQSSSIELIFTIKSFIAQAPNRNIYQNQSNRTAHIRHQCSKTTVLRCHTTLVLKK